MRDRLALHTWTLDTTPLPDVLRIARETGWNAVELRRVDFERARKAGQSAEQVLDQVRVSSLPVAAIGAVFGWMFAEGEERARLFRAIDESCGWAAALDCPIVMSPVDFTRGSVRQAADRLREVGDIAAKHGVRFALELQSPSAQFKTLASVREVVALADHPNCGLLVDTYHVQRTTGGLRDYEDLSPDEIAYVQYSDVPDAPLPPGTPTDRLPPGRGTVPFREVFRILATKGYEGYLSYEAPNPDAWQSPPEEVAREAAEATRALLPG
jgi:2-keto-myo-inositol isomerase